MASTQTPPTSHVLQSSSELLLSCRNRNFLEQSNRLRAPSSVVGSTVGTVEEEEAATKHTKGRVHTVVHRSTG
ncbi:hypothetical protein ACSQ67_011655 [Phaseolus vulgaris]